MISCDMFRSIASTSLFDLRVLESGVDCTLFISFTSFTSFISFTSNPFRTIFPTIFHQKGGPPPPPPSSEDVGEGLGYGDGGPLSFGHGSQAGVGFDVGGVVLESSSHSVSRANIR